MHYRFPLKIGENLIERFKYVLFLQWEERFLWFLRCKKWFPDKKEPVISYHQPKVHKALSMAKPGFSHLLKVIVVIASLM